MKQKSRKRKLKVARPSRFRAFLVLAGVLFIVFNVFLVGKIQSDASKASFPIITKFLILLIKKGPQNYKKTN